MIDQRDDAISPQPLSGLATGQSAHVSHVAGGRMMVQRLAMLGIRPGVLITLLHGPGRRGAVLRLGGTRVALGRGVIDAIMVTPQVRVPAQELAAE